MTQQTLPPGAVPTTSSRNAWLIGGALALAAAAGATGLALRPAAAPTPVAESLANGEALVGGGGSEVAKPVAKAVPAPAKPAPAKAAEPSRVAAAPACATCGTIESVRPVTRKGDASGVGAVAGGVVGAVLGNQVGGGSGRTAATVVGAIGGGFAGNEIEKRTNSTTVYEVRVKMDDGSVRTLEQAQAPQTGARVSVEGKTLKAAPAARS